MEIPLTYLPYNRKLLNSAAAGVGAALICVTVHVITDIELKSKIKLTQSNALSSLTQNSIPYDMQ